MRCIRPTIVGITLALFVPLLTVQPSSAGAIDIDPIPAARDWLVAQQQPDGGFELAAFPGFETPDAVLAIATAAQTGSSWSTSEALAAVQAVDGGDDGATALDWADDFVSGGVSAGLEAKVGLLVALPLGLDPAAFDPRGNGATDLTDQLGTISPGLFNSFLTARMLEARLGRNVHQDDLQNICEAQHLNGGWSYDGIADVPAPADPAPDGVDTAGFATMALSAAGVEPTDPVMAGAADHFEAEQRPSGAWPPADFGFGTPDDPNSTVMSVLGYAAAGEDPSALVPDATSFLQAQQITTVGPELGRIVSPFDAPDEFGGPNTFPTSQTIQGLARLGGNPSWLPLEGPGGRQCLPAHSFNDVPPTAWNDNALRWLAEFDLAAGFPDGGFGPLAVFNRAQASQWFDSFFPDVQGAEHTFPDVSAWFEDGADFVGDPSWPGGAIADGFPPNGEFRGSAPFNRGQAILWMWKAAGRPGGSPPHELLDGAPWFDEALDWAMANGIVSGFPDDTFRPGEQINRGQGAYWFYNLAAGPDAWGPTITRPSTIVHTPPAS